VCFVAEEHEVVAVFQCMQGRQIRYVAVQTSYDQFVTPLDSVAVPSHLYNPSTATMMFGHWPSISSSSLSKSCMSLCLNFLRPPAFER